MHSFNFDEGHEIKILFQMLGEPVGTEYGGAVVYKNIILFAQDKAVLKKFCEELATWDERTTDKTYNIYSWNGQNWACIATKLIRPLESVILPTALKERVLEDVKSFTAKETAKWYYEHGITYKRSYLFYGPPGTGKSSFIRVLAGHLQRNICFLQPANKDMTDENMQRCMQKAPENSIIVLEDIDALFDQDRNSKTGSCPLTFSGLLNACLTSFLFWRPQQTNS
jgi:chaperone BCS1